MDVAIDESDIGILVQRFYERARSDELLGPVFNQAIHDWAEHFRLLTAFWSSVMLGSGRYKGSPVAAHNKHAAQLTPAMFDRWLALWREVSFQVLRPDQAAVVQAKAARIAQSLQLAIEFDPAKRAMKTASKPYRTTPRFNQSSLPAALRRDHSTKAGVWGVIRMISGEAALHFADGRRSIALSPTRPGLVGPKQIHRFEPLGEFEVEIDFYDAEPVTAAIGAQTTIEGAYRE